MADQTREKTRNDSYDPDRENSEQDETGTQAQDVAEDARRDAEERLSESDPAPADDPADLVPRDVPDLVEKQKDMARSGRIDMDAFRGEPKMDDRNR